MSQSDGDNMLLELGNAQIDTMFEVQMDDSAMTLDASPKTPRVNFLTLSAARPRWQPHPQNHPPTGKPEPSACDDQLRQP